MLPAFSEILATFGLAALLPQTPDGGHCLAGQSCFPSVADFSAFNASVGGQLFIERPFGDVCYAKDPAYNKAQCQVVVQNYNKPQWISDHFPAYHQSNWEACGADSCPIPNPLNATASCGQGRVPNYAVYATKPQHIVEYVNFAVKHNLRIVVKNTGHDFTGRSSGQGGFALWTHLLTSKSHNKNFVPKGCKWAPQDSVTLEAGVQWGKAYDFAEKEGITLVGGACPQVGSAGGWILGGGHSMLSPSFGLGVDNLLEVNIVTPDGKLQTVNECSNPDLFWAVRGGGPTTFGILASLTYKARPAMQFGVAEYTPIKKKSLGLAETRKVVAALAASASSLGDLGVGGTFVNPVNNPGAIVLFVLPKGDKASILKATAAFYQSVKGILEVNAFTAPIFHDFYPPTDVSGTPLAVSSRLIPRTFFKPIIRHKVVDGVIAGLKTVLDAKKPVTLQIIFDSPAKPSLNNAAKTSVTPVWYDSLWHNIFIGGWDAADAIHKAANPLRTLTPGSGAYQNEADTYEPDYRNSFWGAKNYARLAAIKKQVDPKNAFTVWNGVGFDDQSPRWRCYKQ